MLNYVTAYVTALIAVVLLDGLWIGVIAKGLYKRALGQLIADRPVLPAAALFYLTYPAGVLIFAVVPAMVAHSWQAATVSGLLFGFFVYATYNLTNWAVVRGWSAATLVFDLPWGSALTAIAALLAYLAAVWMGR